MRVNVPPKYHPAFAAVFGLAPAKLQALAQSFEDFPLDLSGAEAAAKFAKAVGMPRRLLKQFYGATVALSGLCATKGWKRDEVAGEVVASLEATGLPRLRRQAKTREQVVEVLRAGLREGSSLDLLGQANNLWFATPQATDRCTLETEVLPVFSSADETSPSGSVLLHRLVFFLRQRDEEDEGLTVALDSADLRELERLVVAAREKTKALKQALSKTMPVIET